jgi:hypothetical protein
MWPGMAGGAVRGPVLGEVVAVVVLFLELALGTCARLPGRLWMTRLPYYVSCLSFSHLNYSN